MRRVSAWTLTHLGQLRERGDARLVGHVVLAVLHHANAERRALVGHDRAQHELDRLVLEDFALALHEPGLRKLFGERGDEIRLLRVHRHQLAAAAEHGVHLAVDVRVIDANDAEPDARSGARSLRFCRCRLRPHAALPGAAREGLPSTRRDRRRGSGHTFDELPAPHARVGGHQSTCFTVGGF